MRKLRTETGKFYQLEEEEELPEGKVPVADLVLEVVENFKVGTLQYCPFYSQVSASCIFDDISELIGDSKDRKFADQLTGLFRQVVPFGKARWVIKACGDKLMCDGMKVEEDHDEDRRSRVGIQRDMQTL